MGNRTCGYCGKHGHYRSTCAQKPQSVIEAQAEIKRHRNPKKGRQQQGKNMSKIRSEYKLHRMGLQEYNKVVASGLDVSELAKSMTHEAVWALTRIMRSTKAANKDKVAAANALLDRGWGKPHKQVKVSGNVDHNHVSEMTNEELQKLIAPAVNKEDIIDAEFENGEEPTRPSDGHESIGDEP